MSSDKVKFEVSVDFKIDSWMYKFKAEEGGPPRLEMRTWESSECVCMCVCVCVRACVFNIKSFV